MLFFKVLPGHTAQKWDCLLVILENLLDEFGDLIKVNESFGFVKEVID
jgi:hypothetical protein